MYRIRNARYNEQPTLRTISHSLYKPAWRTPRQIVVGSLDGFADAKVVAAGVSHRHPGIFIIWDQDAEMQAAAFQGGVRLHA